MRPVFCFIDDSKFELDLFQRVFPVEAPGIEFILGSTYEEVREKIGDRYPALFILDLYGQDESIDSSIPEQAELANEISKFPGLESVYEGLSALPDDVRTNEFLKRLFHLTDAWRNLFANTLWKSGQSIKYGLGNHRQARKDFPLTPTTAYTRKSMIPDAVKAFQAGMDGLSLKPDAGSDDEIYEKTKEKAEELIKNWSEIVSGNFLGHDGEGDSAYLEAVRGWRKIASV